MKVLEMLGGNRVSQGADIRSELDLVRAAERGFPSGTVDAIVASGALAADEITRFAPSANSTPGAILTPDDSDRLARVARIYSLAVGVLGDDGKASRWHRRPNRGIDGEVPLELLATGEGGKIVEDAMMRMAHGIFA